MRQIEMHIRHIAERGLPVFAEYYILVGALYPEITTRLPEL